MTGFIPSLVILLACAALWFMGVRLFAQSDLSRQRKILWTSFLLLVGVVIGLLLPLREVWQKFLLLLILLPILAAADLWLSRSRRSLAFWIRACGFEVCTVFAVAGAARFLFDLVGLAPIVGGAH